MAEFVFKKATKKQAKARVALSGPAGSGKSYTALRLATAMAKRVAAIDTEHGSLSKYANEFEFDVLELDDYHPMNYVKAIQAAEAAGYEALIIDSASHEWSGKNGCLELVELYAKKSKNGNAWAAWSDVTPLHNAFIEAIHQAKMHIIATFRAKMDYIQVEENGKKLIKKVGMNPITREGAEYEFDIVGELDLEHNLVITKSRCKELADKVFPMPGEDLARAILAWLSDGAPAQDSQPTPLHATPRPVRAEVAEGERPPTEAEIVLFKAAGKPEVLQKRLSDRQWQQAVAKYAQDARFQTYDELVKAAEALGYDGNEVDKIASRHNVSPFDQPGSHSQEQLAAVWADLLDLLKERQQAAASA